MVVFDELPLTSLMGPGGRIDAERYPAFAGLARSANWYRGATAVHDSTALAVPAMLDGRYPRAGSNSDVYSHPANLFTLLSPSYEVNASEEATGLCPTSLCEPMEGTTLGHLSHGKLGRFRRFVRSVHPRPRPTLWFKHVLLPHVPWQFYPSGLRYRRFAPEPIPGLNGEPGFGVPWLVKLSYQRHLLQLGLADRLLGELLARLRRLDLYDDALIVVVADHGIGFHLGDERRAVTRSNVEDLAPVPLLVKLPRERRGRVIDRHVETIDVFPTILELAGVPAPARIDGRSLLRSDDAQARRARVFHRVGKDLNTVGGDYTFDVDALERRRGAAVRRKLALFGSGGGRDPEALYRIGPHAELVGRSLGERPARPRPGHGGDPPGSRAGRGQPILRLRAGRDHRRDPKRPAGRRTPNSGGRERHDRSDRPDVLAGGLTGRELRGNRPGADAPPRGEHGARVRDRDARRRPGAQTALGLRALYTRELHLSLQAPEVFLVHLLHEPARFDAVVIVREMHRCPPKELAQLPESGFEVGCHLGLRAVCLNSVEVGPACAGHRVNPLRRVAATVQQLAGLHELPSNLLDRRVNICRVFHGAADRRAEQRPPVGEVDEQRL